VVLLFLVSCRIVRHLSVGRADFACIGLRSTPFHAKHPAYLPMLSLQATTCCHTFRGYTSLHSYVAYRCGKDVKRVTRRVGVRVACSHVPTSGSDSGGASVLASTPSPSPVATSSWENANGNDNGSSTAGSNVSSSNTNGNDAGSVATASASTAATAPSTTSSSNENTTGSTDWRWEASDDAVRAYGSLVALLLAGSLPVFHSAKMADVPYFVGLALTTIYIGAHKGLTTRQRQQISLKEGALAPLLASASLFGFYLLLKYLPDLNVQVLLNAYFWALGCFAVGGAAVPLLRRVGGPLGSPSIRFGLPEGLLKDEAGNDIRHAQLSPTDILAVALALLLPSAELASGHTNFSLNNLVACLIASDILQLVGPRSFRTAGLLLTGLLLYDVFWVFGSPKVVGDNVMLAVATSDLVSGPTRILFPRLPGGGSSSLEAAAAAFPFSLLGLGDIAVPGLLACLALRYDAFRVTDMRARAVGANGTDFAEPIPELSTTNVAKVETSSSQAQQSQQQQQQEHQESLLNTQRQQHHHNHHNQQQGHLPVSEVVLQHRTYFTPVLFAYVLGLSAAFVANDVTGLGQPALL
ncbi:hypothetical protein Agub_g3591, partial [Astrephomene gubernaculifera]